MCTKLKRIKKRNVNPNKNPTEVWRYLGEMRVRWLINFFNKIWQTKMMASEWSTLIALYKKKDDI